MARMTVPEFNETIIANGSNDLDSTDPAGTGGAPLAPTGFTAVYLSDTSLSLAWTDNATNELNYELDRSPNGTDTWTPLADPAANATSATSTGLTVDTQYFYRLRAVNAAGNSSYATANGTTTLQDFQLPVGNYEPATTTAELIHPRPDSETPAWAKHRRHYPGIPYAIPVGISFGSWPYWFEAITLPSGATVGSQLTVSGDKLIVGDDYGVVEWANPTVGNHSFHIRVHFQDAATVINVQWNLEVTTTGTIFLDAVSGNDTTGTGLIGAPFKTMDGWYKEDYTDTTFSGYQVYYAAGTYDVVTADVAAATLRMNWQAKPLVHYSEAGVAAIWDFDQTMSFAQSPPSQPGTEEHMSDWFLGEISCIGGEQVDSGRRWNVNAAVSGAFPYDGTGGGMRCTWFRSPQSAWTYTGNSANNAGICFAANTGDVDKTRSHWLVSRCNVSNITNGGTNFNGWFIGNMSYMLGENFSVSGTNFGRGVISAKSSELLSCYRNIDLSNAPNQVFNYDNAGSYAPLLGGGVEVSYCKMHETGTGSTDTVIISGHHTDTYVGSNPYHLPNWHFRNSLSKATATSGRTFRAYFNWPVNVSNDIWCSEGDGVANSNPPENTQLDGDWILYAVASDPFDSNMDLTGTDRTTYLGTHGAEVAA